MARWQCRSKHLDVDIMNVPKVITVCCVLHNVREVQGEVFEDLGHVQETNEQQPCRATETEGAC